LGLFVYEVFPTQETGEDAGVGQGSVTTFDYFAPEDGYRSGFELLILNFLEKSVDKFFRVSVYELFRLAVLGAAGLADECGVGWGGGVKATGGAIDLAHIDEVTQGTLDLGGG
jgi:hypothetical protein